MGLFCNITSCMLYMMLQFLHVVDWYRLFVFIRTPSTSPCVDYVGRSSEIYCCSDVYSVPAITLTLRMCTDLCCCIYSVEVNIPGQIKTD